MSEPFQIRPATRQTVKPLIGLYGKSGSGKTMTALLLARGLVGDTGRITLIDSESGRGSYFSDVIPGGYSVMDIEPPFSPERYQAAIEAAEAQSDCVVVDSLSHEHTGEGGMLDMQEEELDRMAGDNWGKREACKMASWIKPKMAHKKFVQRLLRCKVALICCLRGEEKTHMVKDQGKGKVVTDDFSTPIFDPRFIFELLLNFETIGRIVEDGKTRGGYVIPRKITHPSLAPLMPGQDQQLSIAHGQEIAKWCAGAVSVSQSGARSKAPTELDKLKKELWTATMGMHNGDKARLQQSLWDEGLMNTDGETLDGLTVERLTQILRKVKATVPA